MCSTLLLFLGAALHSHALSVTLTNSSATQAREQAGLSLISSTTVHSLESAANIRGGPPNSQISWSKLPSILRLK